MRIAYVSTLDAQDVHSWSGMPHYVAKALEAEGAELTYIRIPQKPESLIDKVKSRYYRKIAGEAYNPDRTKSSARFYADEFSKLLSQPHDLVFSPGTLPIAYAPSAKPKVFYTDATFAGMIGFYDSFSHLPAENIKYGNVIEQEALSSCAAAVYSSDWAAETAIRHYDVDPRKIKVIPFGANLICQRSEEDIRAMINRRPTDTCHLLFLGVDWERKGGDKALQVAAALNGMGLKTHLHIAGIRALPVEVVPDYVVNHGYISKSTPEGLAAIEQLLADSHFLLLPTQAECYGLVFCEANSFGVPNIATAVGGIGTIVKENVNGRLFPLSANPDDYARYISGLFEDYSAYQQLALSSFQEYRKRLNWEVAGKSLMDVMKSVL